MLSLPLDLRLNADYRYRLERTESSASGPATSWPSIQADLTMSRYRGWVWIDTVSLSSTQAADGPDASRWSHRLERGNHDLRVGAHGDEEDSSSCRDAVHQADPARRRAQPAARRSSGFLTPGRLPEFESERQAARASPHIMFRDTDAGVRYLVKRGTERVVSNSMKTSSKALAHGHDHRPGVRVSAADPRHQLSQLRCQGQRQPVGAALWRSVPARQPAGAQRWARRRSI